MGTNKPDVVARIETFNQGRDPQLLQIKYRNMRRDAFTFFRGSCHLFYEDWPAETPLNETPYVWVCGDLHLENFGSYKGDNRLVYFDINDFDEGLLAPCTWDLTRFLTSLILGGSSFGLTKSESLALCHCALDTYNLTLSKGHARSVERETATGMVKELLVSLEYRDRRTFLDGRTKLLKSGNRKLIIDSKRTLPVTEEERAKVSRFLQGWAATQSQPGFYKLLDMAHRIAGTGSLGLERYILLVEGDDSPNQNYLLDLKAIGPSSLQPYLHKPTQPAWPTEAARAVAIQARVQGTSPALLHAVEVDGKAFILRELQPTQDRVDLIHQWNGRLRRLEKLINTMAQLIAWGELRSGGRQGSAITDELIEFSQRRDWPDQTLHYARNYAAQVETDYQIFKRAYDQGKLGVMPPVVDKKPQKEKRRAV